MSGIFRRVAKVASYVAPAVVGFATGNPWLVGLTAGGMSAARGENLQQALLSGAISGVASYAGSAIGDKISGAAGGVAGKATGEVAGKVAAGEATKQASKSFLTKVLESASNSISKLVPSAISQGASTLSQAVANAFGVASTQSIGSAIGAVIGHKLSHPDTPSMPEMPDYSMVMGKRSMPTFNDILREVSEKVNTATHLAMENSPRDILENLESGKGRFESPIYENAQSIDIKPIELPDIKVAPIEVKPFDVPQTPSSMKSKLSLKELAVLDIPEEEKSKPRIGRSLFPKKRAEIDIFNYKRFPPIKEISKRQKLRKSLGLTPTWKEVA